jgi:Protein tyrosine and serine/threonine kinase
MDPGTLATASTSRVFDEQEGTEESGAGGNEFNFNKKQFSYEELKNITNNFSETIGIGGFGKVFKGRLRDGTDVAVKVRSESSSQGFQQFLNEVTGMQLFT